jgi:O-antigen/teichoic acid export membrane protein
LNQPKASAQDNRLGLGIGWAQQLIQIASGFVLPRLIVDHLGREVLGIWDLGWSLTSYFMLLEAGVGSAVNRYTALYLAADDIAGVNRVVSSVAAVQRVIGSVIVIGCIGLSFFVDHFAKDLSPENRFTAQWLVIILGSAVGISLYGAVYTGVLAGCQKWRIHHGIYGLTTILTFVGMVTALSLGKGLIALALVHWTTEILGRVIRAFAAYRSCPGLSNRLSNADVKTIRQMVSYGGKVYLSQMSQIAMNQTVHVIISAVMGPATLALYARPRSLVRQASFFSQKYAFMLVPRAATLARDSDAKASHATIATESTRKGLLIALPLVTLLTCSGKPLLLLWMGRDFADPLLLAILALGFLCEMAYWPLNSILAGLNYHGRPALASATGALLATLAAGVVMFMGRHELWLVALAVSIPWSLVHGLYIPLYACAKLDMRFSRFMLESWTRPVLSVMPFGLCLLMANMAFPDAPLNALLFGGVPGSLLLAALYWKWALIRDQGPRDVSLNGARTQRASVS